MGETIARTEDFLRATCQIGGLRPSGILSSLGLEEMVAGLSSSHSSIQPHLSQMCMWAWRVAYGLHQQFRQSLFSIRGREYKAKHFPDKICVGRSRSYFWKTEQSLKSLENNNLANLYRKPVQREISWKKHSKLNHKHPILRCCHVFGIERMW